MGLSRAMVGVLPENHDTHLLKWRAVQRIENLITGWIDHRLVLFSRDEKFTQFVHVLLLELITQPVEPGIVQLDFPYVIHTCAHVVKQCPCLENSAPYVLILYTSAQVNSSINTNIPEYLETTCPFKQM